MQDQSVGILDLDGFDRACSDTLVAVAAVVYLGINRVSAYYAHFFIPSDRQCVRIRRDAPLCLLYISENNIYSMLINNITNV
jgi:hypothetical protein